MSDRNTQSSPSAMKHSHEENKRRKGKGSVQGAHRQFAAEKSNRGFGYHGTQSYGGRGK
jgi:hypothetical protein